jgi:hypothetical protein
MYPIMVFGDCPHYSCALPPFFYVFRPPPVVISCHVNPGKTEVKINAFLGTETIGKCHWTVRGSFADIYATLDAVIMSWRDDNIAHSMYVCPNPPPPPSIRYGDDTCSILTSFPIDVVLGGDGGDSMVLTRPPPPGLVVPRQFVPVIAPVPTSVPPLLESGSDMEVEVTPEQPVLLSNAGVEDLVDHGTKKRKRSSKSSRLSVNKRQKKRPAYFGNHDHPLISSLNWSQDPFEDRPYFSSLFEAYLCCSFLYDDDVSCLIAKYFRSVNDRSPVLLKSSSCIEIFFERSFLPKYQERIASNARHFLECATDHLSFSCGLPIMLFQRSKFTEQPNDLTVMGFFATRGGALYFAFPALPAGSFFCRVSVDVPSHSHSSGHDIEDVPLKLVCGPGNTFASVLEYPLGLPSAHSCVLLKNVPRRSQTRLLWFSICSRDSLLGARAFALPLFRDSPKNCSSDVATSKDGIVSVLDCSFKRDALGQFSRVSSDRYG